MKNIKYLICLIFCFIVGYSLYPVKNKITNLYCSINKDYETIKSCAKNYQFNALEKNNIENFDFVMKNKMNKKDSEFDYLYRRAMIACELKNNCNYKKYLKNFIVNRNQCSNDNKECFDDLKFINENDSLIYYKNNQNQF